MTDTEFLDAFERCSLPDGFHHRDHVRLAWLYLRQHDVVGAICRFSGGLKRFAESKGASGLYNETITWAFLLLIHERMARGGEDRAWEEFHDANPDLFRWSPSLLDEYYRPETLRSDLARRVFVLPDRTR